MAKACLIEQAVEQGRRITGDVVELLAVDEARFEAIVCNRMPVSKGRDYEYLFACILTTVAPENIVFSST